VPAFAVPLNAAGMAPGSGPAVLPAHEIEAVTPWTVNHCAGRKLLWNRL